MLRNRLLPLLTALALPLSLPSQNLSPIPQSPRVVAQPELSPRTLPGHLVPWATPETLSSQPVNPLTPLALTLTLARSPEAEAAFEQLLKDQQTPGSPLFHHWLTPTEIGDLFGPLPSDVAALTSWLQAQGLTVGYVAPSRMFVRATAPAATVARALALSFATYSVHGELHRAPTAEPRLPAALHPLVASIQGLDDLPERSFGHGAASARPASSSTAADRLHPQLTSNSGDHFIAPGDFTLLYNLTDTYNNNHNGASQRIAIIGRSRVAAGDLTQFSRITGAGASANVLIPPTGQDPSTSGDDDQLEATLDVERVLGTAPGASVDLIINSNAAGGLFPAAAFAVGNARYAAMNISFGSCEANVSAASVNQWDTLFSQAAAQGTSVFVSSGDSGVAGCDRHDGNPIPPPPAVQIASPNYICASSYATCVGGTEFTADLVNPGPFWSPTSSGNGTSVLGYMSEGAWNEPTGTNSANGTVSFQPIAGAGGVSRYILKPSWQTGPGVPADGHRDTPDVSLSSSIHDAYYACYALGGGDCAANRFEYFWGTSNASPSMAAITAIIDQRLGSLQGNLNPALYRIAANPAFKAFHDITLASSGVGSCDVATPSPCNNSTPGPTSLTGGLDGYPVTAGYDLATGLGSPDAGYLIAALASPSPVALGLSSSQSTYAAGSDIAITGTILPHEFPAPTGTVTFTSNGAVIGSVSTSANAAILHTSALPAGTYRISASYTGDLFYSPADTLNQIPLNIAVVPPPIFTIAAATPALTTSAGSAATDVLTLTSGNNFTSTIALSCTVTGAASQAVPPTCLLSNASPGLPSDGTVNVTASIATTHSSLTPPPSNPLGRGLAGLALLFIFPAFIRSRKTAGSLVCLCALAPLALAFGISGCGGSSHAAPLLPGTNPGTYTINIVGSGTSSVGPITAQTSFNLVVQ